MNATSTLCILSTLNNTNNTLNMSVTNESLSNFKENFSTNHTEEVDSPVFLFDRPDVQALLIILYTAVFVTGFIGNLIVLTVMWLHPRMRSTTNFFLTNLAFADFCVTIFCVLQNLSLYLAQSWIFGNFLCKMYNFVNALSHTASVMILVVHCIERYVAIMRPFKARIILRHRNLLVVLLTVWTSSGIYCSPRLLYFRAVSHKLPDDHYTEVICLADRGLFNSKTFDTISFFLLYLIPLLVMSVLYVRIARFLWISGLQVNQQIRRNFAEVSTLSREGRVSTISRGSREYTIASKYPYGGRSYSSTPIHSELKACDNSMESEYDDSTASQYQDLRSSHSGLSASWKCRSIRRSTFLSKNHLQQQYSANENIRKWRKVVKLLVAVVTCFAICNLPYHLRKMLLYYYYPHYVVTTNEALMATPLTQVLTYLNSALNPILYSFMSHNFRFCIKEVLTCRYTWKGRRRPTKKKYNETMATSHIRLESLKYPRVGIREQGTRLEGTLIEQTEENIKSDGTFCATRRF